jgi:ATP-binding cassette, subfamily B (MDR/TAP), member 1
MFPSWGFVFAYMIEVLYTPVEPCPPASDCQSDWSDIAGVMQDESLKVFYAYVGIIFTTLLGFTLLFYGFGIATEKMNRRVRDAAFTSLLRQEVAWYDVRSPGAINSRLSDDAALLHAYTGEPIRTLVSNLASVLVGVIVSFVYMWYVCRGSVCALILFVLTTANFS